MYIILRFVCVAVVCTFVILLPAFAGSVGGDGLLPTLDNPKLQFANGKEKNNKAEISSVLPNIPGSVSGWTVQQWQQSSLMTGDYMTINDPTTKDQLFGVASYAFTSPDRHSHVWVYKNGPAGHAVYDLYEKGGWLQSGGGSNIFLAANTVKPTPSFDHRLTYSMLVKVSKASIKFQTPTAEKSGAVLAMSFTGFVIQFPSPVNGSTSTMFLQLGITSSRKVHIASTTCSLNYGRIIILSGGPSNAIKPLPFAGGQVQFQPVSYDLNQIIDTIFRVPLPCRSKAGEQQTISFQNIDHKKMVLSGVYIGLETEDRDDRPGATDTAPQGSVEIGIQVSNVALSAH